VNSNTTDATPAASFPRLGVFGSDFWAATSDVGSSGGSWLRTYFIVARQFGSITTVGSSAKLSVRHPMCARPARGLRRSQ